MLRINLQFLILGPGLDVKVIFCADLADLCVFWSQKITNELGLTSLYNLVKKCNRSRDTDIS